MSWTRMVVTVTKKQKDSTYIFEVESTWFSVWEWERDIEDNIKILVEEVLMGGPSTEMVNA